MFQLLQTLSAIPCFYFAELQGFKSCIKPSTACGPFTTTPHHTLHPWEYKVEVDNDSCELVMLTFNKPKTTKQAAEQWWDKPHVFNNNICHHCLLVFKEQ